MRQPSLPPPIDCGLQAINRVYDLLQVDPHWTVWEDRGFTWWGWHCAQRVWSEPAFADGELTTYRLHTQTDVFDGFDGSAEQVAVLNLIGMNATLSGIIRVPTCEGRLRLAASVFVHADNLTWACRLFSVAVSSQIAEAEIISKSMNLCGLRQAGSAHPVFGQRVEMDEVLDIFLNIIRPLGEGESAYIGSEFPEVLEMTQRVPCVLASGDEKGLTSEYPFGQHTALLQFTTGEKHPRAGSGLLCRLTLPDGEQDFATQVRAIEFNEAELASMTRCQFIGSWSAGEMGLTHVTFAPNFVHSPGALSLLVVNQEIRCRWVTEEIFNFNQAEYYSESSARRLSDLKRFMESDEN